MEHEEEVLGEEEEEEDGEACRIEEEEEEEELRLEMQGLSKNSYQEKVRQTFSAAGSQ